MTKQQAFDKWFKETIGTPKTNMSIYMRQLLKQAFFDAYDLAIEGPEMKERYKAGYEAGYQAKRRNK